MENVIIVSIRPEWIKEILEGRKHIEFRDSFPQDFEGTVFVYACGPKSCHKIVAKFRTAKVTRFYPEYLKNAKKVEMLDELAEFANITDEEAEVIVNLGRKTLVPILEPEATEHLTLEKWSEKYGAQPKITKAPYTFCKTAINTEVK